MDDGLGCDGGTDITRIPTAAIFTRYPVHAIGEIARPVWRGVDATGLAPNRDFGVRVHTDRCGQAPADAGPHYQDQVDPVATEQAPSVDPAYANPLNEVWFDVTTDGSGNARSVSTVDWEFRPGDATSVVLHAQRTMTGPGQAGMAGDRLACIDEDF